MRGIASLTGIRGIAAVWVLSYHLKDLAATLFRNESLGTFPVVERGWAGVDLFFVLSGFVLMHAHGRDFSQISGEQVSRFAKLRIARVYPLSFAVLLAIAALVAADPQFAASYEARQDGNLSAGAFLRTALLATRWFLPGSGDWNQPVWSLSVELLGYAAFPHIALWLGAVRNVRTAIALALISLTALAIYSLAAGTFGSNYIDTIPAVIRMACCFFAGAALCRAKALAPNGLARKAGALSLISVSIVAISVISWRLATLMPLGFSALVFTLSFEKGPVNSVLASPPAMFLGRISFPLYLSHVMAISWLRYHLADTSFQPITAAAILLICTAGCLCVATLLHHTVERPAHSLGRVWASGRRTATQAYGLRK